MKNQSIANIVKCMESAWSHKRNDQPIIRLAGRCTREWMDQMINYQVERRKDSQTGKVADWTENLQVTTIKEQLRSWVKSIGNDNNRYRYDFQYKHTGIGEESCSELPSHNSCSVSTKEVLAVRLSVTVKKSKIKGPSYCLYLFKLKKTGESVTAPYYATYISDRPDSNPGWDLMDLLVSMIFYKL